MEKQSKLDSALESISNVMTGFFISWAVWVFIVDPVFGFHVSGGGSFAITCIFTVSSLARQYVLRRLFNGRTIYQVIRGRGKAVVA